VRLDELHQGGDDLWIKGLVEARGTEQIPGVDDEIDETQALEGRGGDLALRACNGLPGRCRGERVGLAPRRLDHGGNRIVAQLIAGEHAARRVAFDAGQQQGGEAVAHHHVLDQLAHRDVRRRHPIPCVRGQLSHDPFELRRRRVDQPHIRQASEAAIRYGARRRGAFYCPASSATTGASVSAKSAPKTK
jgi:hypothetical protein